jgi:hypothetical protein
MGNEDDNEPLLGSKANVSVDVDVISNSFAGWIRSCCSFSSQVHAVGSHSVCERVGGSQCFRRHRPSNRHQSGEKSQSSNKKTVGTDAASPHEKSSPNKRCFCCFCFCVALCSCFVVLLVLCWFCCCVCVVVLSIELCFFDFQLKYSKIIGFEWISFFVILGHMRLRIGFVAQAKTTTPTFVFFVNEVWTRFVCVVFVFLQKIVQKPELVHFSFERFLENAIREVYPFRGSPISILWKKKEGKEKMIKKKHW